MYFYKLIFKKMTDNNSMLFLKNVKLSGFKSIIDVDIEFKSGLNIIIGKNAVGKTNFLTFLNNMLGLSYSDLLNFSSRVLFKNGSEIEIEANSEIKKTDLLNSNVFTTEDVNIKISKNGKVLINTNNKNIEEELIKNNLNITTTFIRHGIPKNFYIVDAPFSFKVDKIGFPTELSRQIRNIETPYFIKSLLASFLFSSLSSKNENNLNKEIIRERIINIFDNIEKIKKTIIQYSPIEDIRFNENFNVFLEDDTEQYTINNLFLEFKIEGNWHPFSNLSDGTKRLFYIIAEISYSDIFYSTKSSFGFHTNSIPRIILLEEPELGIHPHQLMKLMNFIKEQTKKKQIILTTHSPQILNIFDANELDRIIIAYAKNSKKGTKLRHLNNEEILKAQKYLENDFLSDYWQYSDLEI